MFNLCSSTFFVLAAVLSLFSGKKESTVSFGDFVGSETCASCHETQYNAWKGSTHGKAGGVPGKDVVIAPFNGTSIRFKDAVVIQASLRTANMFSRLSKKTGKRELSMLTALSAVVT